MTRQIIPRTFQFKFIADMANVKIALDKNSRA